MGPSCNAVMAAGTLYFSVATGNPKGAFFMLKKIQMKTNRDEIYLQSRTYYSANGKAGEEFTIYTPSGDAIDGLNADDLEAIKKAIFFLQVENQMKEGAK